MKRSIGELAARAVDALIDAVLIMATVIVIVFVLADAVYSEDLEANAAAAIAITDAPRPKPIPAKLVQATAKKPIVRFYTASWCRPCQAAKADIAKVDRAQLPFEIQQIDISDPDTPRPEWCETIPAFAWDVQGGERFTTGWDGVSRLTRTWKANQQALRKPVIQAKPMISSHHDGNGRYFTSGEGPGSLSHHLRTTHGINTHGMSWEQMEAAHARVHGWRH